MPGTMAQRYRKYRPKVSGWEVELVFSRTSRAEIRSCIGLIERLLEDSPLDGTHVLAFQSSPESDKKSLSHFFYPSYRLVWLNKTGLGLFGTIAFEEWLQTIVTFEQEWRSKVRPSNANEALVLPEFVFTSARALHSLWERASKLSVEHDDIQRVAGGIKEFRRLYYRDSLWEDENGIRYDPRGELHGIPSLAKHKWKYAYQYPLGFHYDVSCPTRRAFLIQDAEGVRHQFSRHTNVDPHGYVRGGD